MPYSVPETGSMRFTQSCTPGNCVMRRPASINTCGFLRETAFISSTDLWFASGSTQLLNTTIRTESKRATSKTGRMSDKGEIPAALTAVISWSPDIRPNAIRLATSTAIGIESESIHARFNAKISRTVDVGNPLDNTLSKILTKKSTTNKKVMPKSEAKKGPISSFKT